MKKNELNTKLRKFVKEHLSPTQNDIQFVSAIYQSFNDLLGTNNCIQIGSYPRYTAIRPLHDLDILYIIGNWETLKSIPENLLTDLANKFTREYKNPTSYKIEVAVQTHSISFKYLDGEDEVFAVDIVPSLINSKNEFGLDTYYVPEIIKLSRGQKRTKFYNDIRQTSGQIDWIKSDPRGYIEIAKRLNKENSDFRKSVKFVKGWKNYCKERNENFKLKSFHLEQLITEDFTINNDLTIFDSVFVFFTSLKEDIERPKIKDRADSSRYIDEYLNDLTESEYELIINAIDSILIAFENIRSDTNFEHLINSGFYKRVKETEKFLFDQKIATLIDNSLIFNVDGFIKKFDGFRNYTASLKKSNGIVDTKNYINFKVVKNETNSDLVKWKVQNDKTSEQPRGEITDHKTRQNPENTAYIGKHYAECYAIKNNECLAKDKVYVIVKR
ncbi:hypothetical protein ES692_17040 [Psychroserpens burtonensis]|uniref:Adenylyl/Guanylyl and SMODS C-terminal sensor domain-containing protein n=1 Tax=Psychroserpens burtonensis TaxID=49278 RepID=A0A5C7B2F8_9FLAO|nr:hypothetical protein [Psychroserpens burtonensis]TXE15362.1 hypothetical protein ES692_17040 [Psychroserpens burtonensis]